MSAGKRSILTAAVLLAGVLAVHLALRWMLPTPGLWGDENHYAAFAVMDDVQGRSSLVPGHLRFDHRPGLAARVFSLVTNLAPGDPSLDDATAAPIVQQLMSAEQGTLFRRVEALQISLMVGLVGLTFALGRALGLGLRGATSAGAIVGLFPALAFHAHALWPELLHACLVAGCFLALALVRGTSLPRNLGLCLVAGLALGYALLTKGTLSPFAPLLVLLVGFRACTGPVSPGPGGRARGLALAGALLLGALAVVVPQMWANESAGHGFSLAANRWWNLELGLTDLGEPDPDRLAAARADGLAEGMERWLPVMRTSMTYFQAAQTPAGRERLAKQRTLADLERRGWGTVFVDQIPKYLNALARPESSLAQAVTYRERWGANAPSWLAVLAPLARITWLVLLALGLWGLWSAVRAGGDWTPTVCIVLYMFAAFFLVPVKARFLLPVIPFLALCAGKALDSRGAAPQASAR